LGLSPLSAQVDSIAGASTTARQVLDPVKQFEMDFRAAEMAYLNGDTETAKTAMAKLLSSNAVEGPELATVAYRYALLNRSREANALYWLDRGLELNQGRDTGLWLALLDAKAEIYRSHEQPEGYTAAALCYEQALALYDRSYSRHLDAVEAWFKAGQVSRAFNFWELWGQRFGQGPQWERWQASFQQAGLLPNADAEVSTSERALLLVAPGQAESKMMELAAQIRENPSAAGMEELAAWMYLNGESQEILALATEMEALYPFSSAPAKLEALGRWAQAWNAAEGGGWKTEDLQRLSALLSPIQNTFGSDNQKPWLERPLYQALLRADALFLAEKMNAAGLSSEASTAAEWKLARDLHMERNWPLPKRCQPYIEP